ncbi:MAG: heavy metal-binding domain-containing protein [Pseudomonadota bacterium]
MKCTSVETLGSQPIKHGELVHACAVSGANVVRDMREVITNVVGGKMKRYEAVLDQTIERAVENLKGKATEAGYDGVIGVRISHPNITDGAIEVVVVGTGFWYEN